MDIRRINEEIAVAGQIDVRDVDTIARMGFRTLVSNRPDYEDGTVPHEKIRQAAESAGLSFHYIPVVSGAITEENVAEMAAALRTAERPILAYCRSGARSTNLLSLAASSKK